MEPSGEALDNDRVSACASQQTRQHFPEWPIRIKYHVDRGWLAEFREKEKNRSRRYRQTVTVSEERRQIIREKTRVRVARHRQKRRELQHCATKSAVAAWQVKVLEQKADKVEKQRQRRAAMSQQQRDKHNARYFYLVVV